jgi:Na+-transporting NADH:ubiquinone oxidoreductase subunit NqrF
MIRNLLKRSESKIILFYSIQNEDEIIYQQELEQLKNDFPNFEIRLYLSQPSGNHFKIQRLNIPFLQKELPLVVSSPSEALYFLCGPFTYMRMINMTLTFLEVPKTQIRKETFFTEKTNPGWQPEFKGKAEISYRNSTGTYNFTAQWPETILKSSQENNLNLPFSCNAGRCATCVCKLISGKVSMSVNEVLTEKELKQGLVLVCTGYPETEKVVLEQYKA